MLRIRPLIALAALGLSAALTVPPAARAADEPVTLESLLLEMVDRDRSARLPSPPYTCRQFSSYDRGSLSPDDPRGWYANMDRSHFLSMETRGGRTECVLMDTEGPGAIVRFWATWHGPGGGEFSNGRMCLYLDGNPEPAIAGPMSDLVGGGLLVGAPLSQSVSVETERARRGHNLYLPIPYAERCRITYETDVPIDAGALKGEALYYQINYRTYAEGTQVASFSQDRLNAAAPTLERVQKELVGPGEVEDGSSTVKVSETGDLGPGERGELVLPGPGALRELRMKLESPDLEQALRSTILEIRFDGRRTVWCPVGAFFGTGPRLQAYRTRYTGADEDGTLFARWVMPYEREARLIVHNLGDRLVSVVKSEVASGPWTWDERSMHFHATWYQLTRQETRGTREKSGANAVDLNYVTIKGQGVYVGDTLTVFNGSSAWWGEGDEKIYIDGETFPSHFGTGTEDYYGYAWCRPAFFCAPFHAQPHGHGNLASGLSVNSRYRALDVIPFRRRLQVDMELWHWADTKVNYAPATFWYARPGAEGNVAPDPVSAALPVAREREDVAPVPRVKGAQEGEDLPIAEKSGGTTEVQAIAEIGWSAHEQLWWRDGKPGDRIVLTFEASSAGQADIELSMTEAHDYGVADLYINGKRVKRGVDFYRPHPQVEKVMVPLPGVPVEQGANRLTIELTGSNPEAAPRHMVGLDYILVTEPASE